MQGAYTFRTNAAMIVLAGLALASSAKFLIETAGLYLSPNVQVTDVRLYQARYAEMRSALSPTEPVGYLTDAPDPKALNAIAEFDLTQYALAPVVVKPSSDALSVVTNFHGRQPPAIYHSRGLRLVKDYGNGALLLTRSAR